MKLFVLSIIFMFVKIGYVQHTGAENLGSHNFCHCAFCAYIVLDGTEWSEAKKAARIITLSNFNYPLVVKKFHAISFSTKSL